MLWISIIGCQGVGSAPLPTPPTDPVTTPPSSALVHEVVFWGSRTGEAPALHLSSDVGGVERIADVLELRDMLADPSGDNLVFLGRLTDAETEPTLYTVALEPGAVPSPTVVVPETARITDFSEDGTRVAWAVPDDSAFGIVDLASGTGFTYSGDLYDVGRGPVLQPPSGDWWFATIENELVVARWDGSDQRVQAGSGPAWQADGSGLMVLTDDAVTFLEPDGTLSHSVPFPTLFDESRGSASSTAQPSGTRMAFATGQREAVDLWGVSASSDQVVLLSHPHPEFPTNTDFRWSPSGQTLLYASSMDQLPGRPPDLGLYLTTPTAAGARQVGDVAHSIEDLEVVWSPDERYVAVMFEGYGGESHEVQVIDLQTGEGAVPEQGYDWRAPRPRWSPDGTRVYARAMIDPVAGSVVELPTETMDLRHRDPTAWLDDSSAVIVQTAPSGALAAVAPDGTLTSLVDAGFDLTQSEGKWQVLGGVEPPAPFVPDVPDLSDPLDGIPDPAPASHRYVTPSPGTTFTSMSAGHGFCGLQDDGVPVCSSNLTAPPAGVALSRVSVGADDLVCGVGLADDVMHCWGADVPSDLPTSTEVMDVQAGNDTVCALLTDGSLQCWGAEPTALTGPFTALSVGASEPAVRRPDGSLVWGTTDVSALGSSFDSFLAGRALCTWDDGTTTCLGSNGVSTFTSASAPRGRFSNRCHLQQSGRVSCQQAVSDSLIGYLAGMPSTGLRFEEVTISDSWFCGLTAPGDLMFCREAVMGSISE